MCVAECVNAQESKYLAARAKTKTSMHNQYLTYKGVLLLLLIESPPPFCSPYSLESKAREIFQFA